jgi:hypothetical protein
MGMNVKASIKIPVNPRLPARFDDTPNEERPVSHHRWWFVPYVVRYPNGLFVVCCLDGGAWDRSTVHGGFDTLAEAEQAARRLAENYQPYREMSVKEAVLHLWHQGEMVMCRDKDGNHTFRAVTVDDITL